MLDLNAYMDLSDLVQQNGIWRAAELPVLSYPEQGRDMLLNVEDHSYWFLHRNRCIAELVRQCPAGGPIFDVGGGNGFVAKCLEEAGCGVVLVEPSVGGVCNAQKRGCTFPIICAEFGPRYFKENTIPAVALCDVIEHVEDDAAFLQMVYRMLAPNGRVYITVPAGKWLWSDVDVESGHYRRYTLSGLKALLERCGLTVPYATYFFSYLPIPIFLGRVMAGKHNPKKQIDNAQVQNQFVKKGVTGKVLSLLSNWEFSRIRRQQRIMAGSSLLIAAQK